MLKNISLKQQLAFRVSVGILLIWLLVIGLFVWDRSQLDHEGYVHDSILQRERLNYLIAKESQVLLNLLERFTDYLADEQLTPEDDITQFRNKLNQYWKTAKLFVPEARLSYYSPGGELLAFAGLLSLSENKIGGLLKEAFNEGKNADLTSLHRKNFIECEEICYLSVVYSSSPHNLSGKQGFYILKIPLEKLLWELNETGNIEVAILSNKALYSFNPKIMVGNQYYYINFSSDDALFMGVATEPIEHPVPYLLEENANGRYALLVKLIVSDGVFFLTSKDVTQIVQHNHLDLLKVLALSLIITLITLLLINYLLHSPLKILQLMSDALPLIGQGRYQQVLDKLAGLPATGIEVREIVRMKANLKQAVVSVDSLHRGLSSSVEQVSGELSFIQQLINASKVLFVIHDEKGRIQLCNDHAAEVLAMQQSELLGEDYFKVFNVKEVNRMEVCSNNANDHVCLYQSRLNIANQSRLISWSQNIFFHALEKKNMHICTGMDITERLEMEQRIRYLAHHDELTGLVNRRRLNELLQALLLENKKFYFLYIDLNYFKVINDTLGHAAGDKLLISFSSILEKAVNDQGVAARTGGDEFTVVLFLDKSEVVVLCDALIEQCKTISLFGENDKFLSAKVGLSIGVVAYPEQASNEADLHAMADAAMYENKIERSSSYHFYTGQEQLIQQNRSIKHWTDRLEECLEQHKITPYFQSVHHAKQDMRPVFYEVLSRIKQAKLVIAADQFIDQVANKPVIAKLDLHILQLALDVMRNQTDQYCFLINISAYTLSLPQALNSIQAMVAESQCLPQRIIFEITEQAVIKDVNLAVERMNSLRQHGFRFALDDFGTGYSSLSYLQRLPIQFLKLDKTFLLDADEDEEANLAFMSGIIATVRSLGIEVIVEGVENARQARLARRAQADYLQGYFFSKPQESLEKRALQLGFYVT